MPAITSCIYNQPSHKFHCVDQNGKEFVLVPEQPESDKLICIPYTDFDVLISYCKRKR